MLLYHDQELQVMRVQEKRMDTQDEVIFGLVVNLCIGPNNEPSFLGPRPSTCGHRLEIISIAPLDQSSPPRSLPSALRR